MHEMSIATSILDAVRGEAALRPGARVVKVGLRLGELAGVDRDSLGFCFESLVSGSDLAPLALEIDYRPRRQRCASCGKEFEASGYDLACPACGNTETRLAGGDEMELAYLELEEP